MHTLMLVGLALSAALVVPAQAASASGNGSWCRIARDVGGRDCSFYTFAQCAASTERLDGGGCYENPFPRGTSAAVRGERSRVPQRKLRNNDANR
jgi:hypothetical protein